LATGITAGETDAVPQVAATSAAAFLAERRLGEEVFGPASLVVSAATRDELLEVARHLDGQLTATVHGTPADLEGAADLLAILATRAGRLIVNGFPTGVEVGHAMQHGGPWPATSDPRFTSVGSAAAERFVRPVCWQDVPDALLPPALQNDNPLGLLRLVDGKPTRDRVG
jgi:NADP-dependent aldehyde dehydrogenase